MFKLAMKTLVVLALFLVSSAACVPSFSAFEKAVLADDGNVEALAKAFYRVNRPFPLSVQVVYHINSSNGTETISTDPSCPPGKEIWLWVSSPVLIFIDPTKLNLYALYTLNYFSYLWSPEISISVPNIYNASLSCQFSFLSDFTMRVQTYAAASLPSENGYLGYVIRGCGTEPFKRAAVAILPDNANYLEEVIRTMVGIYMTGSTLQIVVMLLLCAHFLHNCKKGSNNTVLSSFNNYGLFWGCVTVSFLGNVLLTAHGIIITHLHLTSGVPKLIAGGWITLAQLVFATIASLLIAIYYGRNLNFMIPFVFLLPFAILCCNHTKEAGKKIVQCLSIWSLLMFILHVSSRASYMFLALLARPPVVISTVLVYIFATFYLVHFLAIIFTFAKAKKQQQRKTNLPSVLTDLAQALILMVIFAAAVCFGSLIGFAGLMANYGTIMNSPYSVFSTLISQLALGGLSWVLRKIGLLWLRSVTCPNAAEQAEMTPLLQEQMQKSESAEVDSKQVLQLKFPTLVRWLMQ